jgi:regulator of replication initiation timing
MKGNELHEKLIELKSQLIKSEEERRDLRKELNEVLKRSVSLECELKEKKNQLDGKETVTEGFGTQSPLHTGNKKKNSSLVDLQEKAKGFLASSPNNSTVDNAVALQQLIEDFCRETDFYIENDKRTRDDLQNQVRKF